MSGSVQDGWLLIPPATSRAAIMLAFSCFISVDMAPEQTDCELNYHKHNCMYVIPTLNKHYHNLFELVDFDVDAHLIAVLLWQSFIIILSFSSFFSHFLNRCILRHMDARGKSHRRLHVFDKK